MKSPQSRFIFPSLAVAAIAAAFLAGFGASAARAQPLIPIPVGDYNFDGQVNQADGSAMAAAVVDPTAYQIAHGITSAELLARCDINADARFNNQDINPFLQYLANLGSVVSSSYPAMLYFSASSTTPGATSPTNTALTNPNITITQGTSTTIYLWAQLNDLQAVNGLAVDIRSTNGSVATATARTILNPFNVSGVRWDGLNPGVLGSAGSVDLLTGENAVFVNGNFFGLDGGNFINVNGTYVAQGPNADGSGEPIVGSLLVGSLTLFGQNIGTTDLFLATGNGSISYESGRGGPGIRFGAGDAPVFGAQTGMASQLADATITVVPVPEPASSTLLAAGLVLAAIKQYRRPGSITLRRRRPWHSAN